MAFRFPLEALRKLRQSEERQQELLLMEANSRVAAIEMQIAELENQMHQAADAQLSRLKNPSAASELHFDLICRRAAEERQRALQKKLLEALAARESRQKNFEQARRRREVLDSLRSHQAQAYKREQIRQEQRHTDEAFLLRSNRARVKTAGS